jgi:hypothetical protein
MWFGQMAIQANLNHQELGFLQHASGTHFLLHVWPS